MRVHCLAIALLIATVSSTPLEALLEEYLESADSSKFDADDDYDIHYDQRQSGTENYRLNVDGVLIAVPDGSDNSGIGSLGLLATHYISDIAAATGNLDQEDADADEDKNGNESHETHADKPYVFEVHDTKKKPLESDLLNLALWNFKNGGGANSGNSPDEKIQFDQSAVKKNFHQQQVQSKSSGILKKRNKHKLRLSSIIDYMQRKHSH